MCLTVGSLFTGIGGLDLGLKRAGMRIVWQVEIDEWCRKVLAKHFPEAERFADVRECGRHNLESVDLICGGFPCKQTSVAAAIHRRRNGLGGADSGLWDQQRRIIDQRRPAWAVVENPPGILRWANEITRGLEVLGYSVSRHEISAADIGAPHLRRRVCFTADRDGKGLASTRPTRSSAAESDARRALNRDAWVQTIAGISRVDDGIPAAMDRRKRIEGLGNAVVPQVAEYIGRLIVEAADN
ncbi:MAG: DNA cytosine methyltransferase [Planctomycetota bacterium]